QRLPHSPAWPMQNKPGPQLSVWAAPEFICEQKAKRPARGGGAGALQVRLPDRLTEHFSKHSQPLLQTGSHMPETPASVGQLVEATAPRQGRSAPPSMPASLPPCPPVPLAPPVPPLPVNTAPSVPFWMQRGGVVLW